MAGHGPAGRDPRNDECPNCRTVVALPRPVFKLWLRTPMVFRCPRLLEASEEKDSRPLDAGVIAESNKWANLQQRLLTTLGC